jgi:hypothetical protein
VGGRASRLEGGRRKVEADPQPTVPRTDQNRGDCPKKEEPGKPGLLDVKGCHADDATTKRHDPGRTGRLYGHFELRSTSLCAAISGDLAHLRDSEAASQLRIGIWALSVETPGQDEPPEWLCDG